MNIVSIALLALAATADSFVIGLGYGVKHVRINSLSNLFLSGICFLGTLLAMVAGRLMGNVIPLGTADLLGSLVLLGFGAYMLYTALAPPKEGLRSHTSNPEAVDRDGSKVIEPRESFWVGVMLSINNMGLGIGAGMAGIPVVATPLVCALTSFLFIAAGCSLGNRIRGDKVSKILEIGSALLVMALGILGLN